MPIYYSQSSRPRTFEYQQRANANTSLELQGNSKKVDTTASSMGSWNRLLDKTFANARPNFKLLDHTDTRRTIQPEVIPAPQTQERPRSTVKNPGNMNNLFEKTGNDNVKYDQLRKSKKFNVSSESQNEPLPKERRIVKSNILKENYDYTSQIVTLPITQTLRVEKSDPTPKIGESKSKYDYKSSISTLPGTQNNRDGKAPSPERNTDKQRKRFALTSEETKNDNGPKFLSPKHSYKNGESHSGLDQAVQLNPMSKPILNMEGRNKTWNQSQNEYFCLREHNSKGKGTSASSRNLFRSQFELA